MAWNLTSKWSETPGLVDTSTGVSFYQHDPSCAKLFSTPEQEDAQLVLDADLGFLK